MGDRDEGEEKKRRRKEEKKRRRREEKRREKRGERNGPHEEAPSMPASLILEASSSFSLRGCEFHVRFRVRSKEKQTRFFWGFSGGRMRS